MSKQPLETDDWKPSHKKKNTKKWCKGKVGVEHEPVVELDKNYGWLDNSGHARCTVPEPDDDRPLWMNCTHTVVCKNCEKVLKMHPDVCPTTGLKVV